MARNPLNVPATLETFANGFVSSIHNGIFLGDFSTQDPYAMRECLRRTRAAAKLLMTLSDDQLTPNKNAMSRTNRAACAFFSAITLPYPLAGLNKCIGFVAVPGSRLVMISVSQDKDPLNDIPVRVAFMELVDRVNQCVKGKWIFELVCVPKKFEYFILRTLAMRASHQAPTFDIEPRTRCCEIALMAALCKIGRFRELVPCEIGVATFDATLWLEDGTPVFKGLDERNTKYCTQPPLKVNNALLYPWDRCGNHCQRYWREMAALSCAGGRATTFVDPRGEFSCNFFK